jgi:hypothetical protein
VVDGGGGYGSARAGVKNTDRGESGSPRRLGEVSISLPTSNCRAIYICHCSLDALVTDLQTPSRTATPNALRLAPNFGEVRFPATLRRAFAAKPSGSAVKHHRHEVALFILYVVVYLVERILHRLTFSPSFFLSGVFPGELSIDGLSFFVFRRVPALTVTHTAGCRSPRQPSPGRHSVTGPALGSRALRTSCYGTGRAAPLPARAGMAVQALCQPPWPLRVGLRAPVPCRRPAGQGPGRAPF